MQPTSVKARRTTNDAVHLVALVKQKLRPEQPAHLDRSGAALSRRLLTDTTRPAQ